MKIKCVENKIKSLPTELQENYNRSEETLSLFLNKEYTVYGMYVNEGITWYLICDRSTDDYPLSYPSMLFEISNPQLSRYWIFNFGKSIRSGSTVDPVWVFPEWANDYYNFYDKLTDWEETEAKIFKEYKELMDVEFPDNSISEKAEILDKEWVMCPMCIDAWHSPDASNGMIQCPKCKKFMHNPRYVNKLALEDWSIKI